MTTSTEAPPLITEHKLKIWPEFFEAVLSGIKNFEVRDCTDRDFYEGDTLRLQEYDPERGYTGRETTRTISYILRGGAWGIPNGMCILSWPLDEAANARIAELKAAQEWKPTHRSKISPLQVKAFTTPLGNIEYEYPLTESRRVAPEIFNEQFEPLPEPGEKAPCHHE